MTLLLSLAFAQEVPDLGPERLEFTVVDWMTGGFV